MVDLRVMVTERWDMYQLAWIAVASSTFCVLGGGSVRALVPVSLRVVLARRGRCRSASCCTFSGTGDDDERLADLTTPPPA